MLNLFDAQKVNDKTPRNKMPIITPSINANAKAASVENPCLLSNKI